MQTPKTPVARRRLAFVVALAASLTALFTVLGGAGLAQGLASAVQYQYGKKVTICHKGKTIKVATASWKAHQRHGDTQGACATDRRKGKNRGKSEVETERGAKPTRDDRVADRAAKAEKPEKAEKAEKAEKSERSDSDADADDDSGGDDGGKGRGKR